MAISSIDCRDYNRQLRVSLAVEELAEQIYYARAVAWSLPNLPAWKDLSHETRERYREVALSTIEAVKPQPRGLPPVVITGLGPIKGVVVGAIQPAPREPLRMAKADLRVTQESGI